MHTVAGLPIGLEAVSIKTVTQKSSKRVGAPLLTRFQSDTLINIHAGTTWSREVPISTRTLNAAHTIGANMAATSVVEI